MRARIVAMGLVLVFLSSSAFALIGPPTAELNKGQWSIGGNYQYSSIDMGTQTMKGIDSEYEFDEELEDDVLVTDPWTDKIDVKDFDTNLYFGRLSYGLLDSLDVYGQVGIADLKLRTRDAYIDPNDPDEWSGNNFDNELALGLGAKYTFYKQEKMDWGVAAELNLFSNSMVSKETGTWEDGEASGTWEDKTTTDADTLSILIAVGPTIDMSGWKLYGGALCQIVNCSIDFEEIDSYTVTGGEGGIDEMSEGSGDIDQTSFGGYVGASVDIYGKYNLAVEFVGTGDGWGAGAGITIPF